MTTMTELINAGVQKMRLPAWSCGYAVPRPGGPWVDVYDVNAGIVTGTPIAILIVECDRHDDWEPYL